MRETVDAYINKQNSPKKEILTELRRLIKNKYPGVKEEMLMGAVRFGDNKCYIISLADRVNLGILSFDGKKTMKTKEIKALKDINEAEITRLI
ncbi:MAG: DUF1801 domain-containing protein [Candidatus Nanoarchaeia archaeon]|jgi:hypothetical protein